jgi:hypothetical protein
MMPRPNAGVGLIAIACSIAGVEGALGQEASPGPTAQVVEQPRVLAPRPMRPVSAAVREARDGRPQALQLFPPRDDYAWEGMAVGAVLGALIGIGINVALSDVGDAPLGVHLLVVVAPMAVTVPTGLLIGGAIPKPNRSEEESPGSR